MAATAPPKGALSVSSSDSGSIGYESDGVVDFEAEVTSFHRAMKEKKSGRDIKRSHEQDTTIEMRSTDNACKSRAALHAQQHDGLQSCPDGGKQDQGKQLDVHACPTHFRRSSLLPVPAEQTGM
jgi:hypothetical protein